jgi:hypothetical protein
MVKKDFIGSGPYPTYILPSSSKTVLLDLSSDNISRLLEFQWMSSETRRMMRSGMTSTMKMWAAMPPLVGGLWSGAQ